jgi:hypothetical protein
VVCGVICPENRLQIKYNEKNLWNNASKLPSGIRKSNSFLTIKRRVEKPAVELAAQIS